MARPAKHNAATREALLDAAERMLATEGQAAVSVRAVADAIDSSTRAVYSVFGSKEALLEALATRGFAHLADLVDAQRLTDDPIDDLVRAGVGGFRRFAVDRPQLFRITFDRLRQETYRAPAAGAQLARAYAGLNLRIGRAAEAGRLGPHRPVDVAYMFHSFCHGLAANELSRRPPPVGAGFWSGLGEVDDEEIWATALRAFLYGLAAPAG